MRRSYCFSTSAFRGAAAAASLAVAVISLAGCSREDGVERYTVPKPRPLKIVDADDAGMPPGHPPIDRNMPPGHPPVGGGMAQVEGDRMFGAIVLRGDAAWFFKATAARDVLAPHAQKLIDFVKSLRFREDGTPAWTLPDGWKEKPGDQFRYATVLLGGGASPPELSVSMLPKRDDDTAYLLANVNRWRGQLKLPPTDAATLDKESLRIPLADGNTAIVLVLAAEEAAEEATGAKPPTATPPSADGGRPAAIAYETPKGWTDRGASAVRKATLAVVDGDKSIEVAVTSFPAIAEQIADPVANVNRWRQQLGLAEASPDDIAQAMTDITVDGHAGKYVELFAPDAENPTQATLATMFRAGDDMWFVKLAGDGSLAQRERDAFKKFLSSMRLDAGGEKSSGASDGK